MPKNRDGQPVRDNTQYFFTVSLQRATLHTHVHPCPSLFTFLFLFLSHTHTHRMKI